MMDFLQSLAVSSSGMEAQSIRLRHISENIANADTPGYHRKLSAFRNVMAEGRTLPEVEAGPVTLDQGALADVYDPGSPLADASGHYQGSNVDLVVEIADARDAQRSYEANLRMFDQARQMASSLLDLLRH